MHRMMSAQPSMVNTLLPFVIDYIDAAHEQLRSNGWVDGRLGTTLCTQCDEYHPECGPVTNSQGGHCNVRYRKW